MNTENKEFKDRVELQLEKLNNNLEKLLTVVKRRGSGASCLLAVSSGG